MSLTLFSSNVRYFELFPDLIGLDVTFNTNSEKRPMFILVGRTSNGHIIPLLNAFLPSEAKWVFLWLFKEAIPYLLGKSMLSKIRLLTSDEDRQCLDAFEEVREELYPNAVLRLCKWHKVSIRCCPDLRFFPSCTDTCFLPLR